MAAAHPNPGSTLEREAALRLESAPGRMRRMVRESWDRSIARRVDPDLQHAPIRLDDALLRQQRQEHPLAAALPVVRRLLAHHAEDAGLIVAIGDAQGRLLWLEGDRGLRGRAESMGFVEGSDWSEAAVGTSAPGTALALGRAVQIDRAEHYGRLVQPWSCSAVPVRDLATGEVLGVLDITGGSDAVAPVTLPLLEATVAAVEAELQLERMRRRAHAGGTAPSSAPRSAPPRLRLLGVERAELVAGGRTVTLTPRHAEILTLLAWHPEGVSAERLAAELYGREDALVTLRAEIVRLRAVLQESAPSLVPASRPYRLPQPLVTDAHRLRAMLDRGAHRLALAAARGGLLPGSTAPGIVALREELRARLRTTLLEGASLDVLLDYARTDEAALDLEVQRACLRLLPRRSPRRAELVERIAALEVSLG